MADYDCGVVTARHGTYRNDNIYVQIRRCMQVFGLTALNLQIGDSIEVRGPGSVQGELQVKAQSSRLTKRQASKSTRWSEPGRHRGGRGRERSTGSGRRPLAGRQARARRRVHRLQRTAK